MSTDTLRPFLIQQTTSSWIAAKPKMIRPSNNSFLTPYSTTTGNISITPVGKAVEGSVGVGGHINPVDERADPLGKATYLAGVEREIDEELNITGGHQNRIVGLLNDDINDVGKVHLGVVHIFDLESEDVTSAEDALANLAFQSPEDLKGKLHGSLETWSRFCVDELI